MSLFNIENIIGDQRRCRHLTLKLESAAEADGCRKDVHMINDDNYVHWSPPHIFSMSAGAS
jgi:hypothetical protein